MRGSAGHVAATGMSQGGPSPNVCGTYACRIGYDVVTVACNARPRTRTTVPSHWHTYPGGPVKSVLALVYPDSPASAATPLVPMVLSLGVTGKRLSAMVEHRMRVRRHATVFLLLGIAAPRLLTACTGGIREVSEPAAPTIASASSTPPVPTAEVGVTEGGPTILTGSFATALDRELSGRLLVRDSCLVIESQGIEWIPIWPRGYETLRPADDLFWAVIGDGGRIVALVDGDVDVRGGRVQVDMSIPPDCQRPHARFFAVIDVAPPGF
jgi:hypothetical protein